jgi:hypothetical protein
LRVTGTLALWIIIAGTGFVKTLRWCGGNFNAEASGYLIGSALTPALLALVVMWLIHRNRREKDPIEHRHVAVAGWPFFFSLLSFAGSLPEGGPSDTSIQDQARHLLRQATGKEAEVNTNWYDEPAREFYRDVVAFNQEYVQAVHSVRQMPLKKLYQTESYATKGAMQNVIASLQALQEIDKKSEAMKAPVKKLEERVGVAKSSRRQEEDFLKGVHATFAKSTAPRNEAFRTEQEWLQSSSDLYKFTLAHFSE